MSSPNDDENTVFICTHTQAVNGGMNMNDWRWTVNTIIRVKEFLNDRVWTVIELSVFELSVVSIKQYKWQIYTIKYNKDDIYNKNEYSIHDEYHGCAVNTDLSL